jgi:hypothetical protein
MPRYFHATRVQNVPAIKREGLRPIWDYVYLTDSLESAVNWMGFRFRAQGEPLMAVIEVELDPKTLSEGMDHSPLMQTIFGAGASLISENKISKSKIKEIHYFQLGGSPG